VTPEAQDGGPIALIRDGCACMPSPALPPLLVCSSRLSLFVTPDPRREVDLCLFCRPGSEQVQGDLARGLQRFNRNRRPKRGARGQSSHLRWRDAGAEGGLERASSQGDTRCTLQIHQVRIVRVDRLRDRRVTGGQGVARDESKRVMVEGVCLHIGLPVNRFATFTCKKKRCRVYRSAASLF
jgi:hypothetical protein